MVTFIKKFLQIDPERKKYASPFKRSFSSAIDMGLVLILRIIAVQTCGSLWYNKQMNRFINDFQEQFGTSTPKSTHTHVDYILGHPFVTHTLILISIIIFVGVIYYTYFNSSKWQATPGKRIMSLRIIKNNDEDISFSLALSHYLLSITPFIYVFYIAFYKIHNDINFYEAITSSRFNMALGIFFVMWVQIQIFTKRKVTIYDMICNTQWTKQRTNSTYPW